MIPYGDWPLRSSYYLNYTNRYRIIDLTYKGDILMLEEIYLLLMLNTFVLVPYYILFM